MTDWKTILKDKNRFSKSPRQTYTASVIEETKSRGTPGPGTYELKSQFRHKREKTQVVESERVVAFLEEAQYRGMTSPN